VLKASGDVALTAGSTITASGASGGTVTVQSGGTTTVSGTIQTSGSEGTGGTVQVLGNRVGLMDGANVNASGQASGGDVMVGGDFHGANPDVQNASATYISPTATINADAVQSGNGGNVAVWADSTTQFYGSISARGGATSGNGGFVETSGKGWLDFQGRVDTRAPSGASGTLLLDPTDITISNLANTPTMTFGAGCGASTYCDTTATPSNLNVATLTAQLGLSNVTISTASALAGNGDITVNNLISYNSGFNLNLSATRNITVAAGSGITNTGAGALTLTGGGAGSIAVNESLSTNGGTITLTSGSGGVTLANTKSIDAGAGQIAINAGEDGSVVVGKILEHDTYAYGYDAQTGEFGNLVSKGIIDPTKVVRVALQDASSIAGLLITTEAMVAELPKKESPVPAMPGGGGMGGMGGMDY